MNIIFQIHATLRIIFAQWISISKTYLNNTAAEFIVTITFLGGKILFHLINSVLLNYSLCVFYSINYVHNCFILVKCAVLLNYSL